MYLQIVLVQRKEHETQIRVNTLSVFVKLTQAERYCTKLIIRERMILIYFHSTRHFFTQALFSQETFWHVAEGKSRSKNYIKKCCYKKLEHCDSMFMLKEKYYVYLRFIIVFWVTSRKVLQALNTSVFSDASHLCNQLWLVSSCTPETALFTTTEQLSINSY